MNAEKLAEFGPVLKLVVHGGSVKESAFSLLNDRITNLLWLYDGVTEDISDIALLS